MSWQKKLNASPFYKLLLSGNMSFAIKQQENIIIVKKYIVGNSLVVQWLGLGAFTAMARVRSLVGELRSCRPRGVAKKINKKKIKNSIYMYVYKCVYTYSSLIFFLLLMP